MGNDRENIVEIEHVAGVDTDTKTVQRHRALTEQLQVRRGLGHGPRANWEVRTS